MRSLLTRSLLLALLASTLAFAGGPESASAKATHCGNPPNWSGHLVAINVSCHKARVVFHHISCRDTACEEIHSRAWDCYRHHVSRYAARGNCHLGRKAIRWLVFE